MLDRDGQITAASRPREIAQNENEPSRSERGYTNMNRPAKPCAQYGRRLALLAAGALPELEREKMEEHAAACAGCGRSLVGLGKISAELANWEKDFSEVK